MTENYTYDNDGRVVYQEIVDSQSTVQGYSVYSYNDNAQVISDSSVGYFGNYSTAYNYNSRGMISDETKQGANPYAKTYTYDGMRNRTQKVENGTPTSYTYNGLGRITAAGNVSYSYDGNGNLTGKSTGEAFQYDHKNNLVHHTDPNRDIDVYYGYDLGRREL